MINKHVLITTKHRGVFAGLLESHLGTTVTLTGARCAIKWATTEGFLQLAKDGPNSSSKVGSVARRIELYDITSITECTADAEEAWGNAK